LRSLFGFVTLELAAVGDGYILLWLVAALGGEILNLADDRFTSENLTKDDVLPIEVWSWDCSNEELGAVGA
jgi:hypothetical protein